MEIPYLNQIVTGDHYLLQRDLPDNSIDLIYTDPPYPREFLHTFQELGIYAGRVLKEGGSLITLCGGWQVNLVIRALEQSLQYRWIGWLVHGQKQSIFGYRVVAGGKPLLWFTKGRAKIDYGFFWDTKRFEGGRDKRFHEWGQPANYVIQDLNLLTQPGDVVLEPFAGGGTVPAACKMTGRDCISFELDPATAEIARQRVELTPVPLFQVEPEQLPLFDGEIYPDESLSAAGTTLGLGAWYERASAAAQVQDGVPTAEEDSVAADG